MHKFVQTKGKLRYNSQKTEEQWSILILDTLNAIPLEQTAAQIDCEIDTVFHMRHKFLLFLEQLIYEQLTTLEGLMEMDETYIHDGLFSNDELIKQNELTRRVVSDHHAFTPVIHSNTVNIMHSGFKQQYRHYRGVSTKYLNIFMRGFIGMDNQEKLMVFLANAKQSLGSFTNQMVKSQNLLLI